MGPIPTFNFGLIFEADFSSDLVAASQSFQKAQKLVYSLGERSLPHVTILQFPAEVSDASRIWNSLEPVREQKIFLDFHGLAFDRWRDWDGIWLRLKNCPEIRDAQKSAIRILGDRAYVNALGDLYEPHATLAAWPISPRLPAFEIPHKILDRKKIRAFYSLGISGPQFQFESVLFSELVRP